MRNRIVVDIGLMGAVMRNSHAWRRESGGSSSRRQTVLCWAILLVVVEMASADVVIALRNVGT